MKLIVTGTEGYIGSVLASVLMQEGHEVVGFDTGFYKNGWLYNPYLVTPKTHLKDIRNITLEDLEGIDGVVHLAELSNDPLGQLSPEITYKINYEGSVRLANLAKQAGVKRFVYTSSCSVYGVATDAFVTEETILNPQTAYAKCKVLVEQNVAKLAGDDFSPTFLRNATAYGVSPRMRFDIVLNNLAGLAWTTQEIKMLSDGTPWRPLVHVLDICQAILKVLEAPREVVHNEVFNVGANDGNYQVKEIAEIVAQVFKGCTLSFGNNGGDNRSYRVNFDKIQDRLPGFRCKWDARAGAEQLLNIFSKVHLAKDDFFSKAFTRLKQLEFLLESEQINSDFFWEGV